MVDVRQHKSLLLKNVIKAGFNPAFFILIGADIDFISPKGHFTIMKRKRLKWKQMINIIEAKIPLATF